MRYRFVPPSRADGTLAPAGFVAVLAMLAVAQLMMTDAVDLPSVGPIGAGAPVPPLADPGSRGVPAAIFRRPMFAPSAQSGGGDDGAAAADPLGGVAIVGAIGIGRVRFAIVQGPGSVSRRVGLGGAIAGWRLIGITADAALLARGGERLRRPFGGGAPATPSSGQAETTDGDSQ